MKPERTKKVKGWKRDHHIHENHRKVRNWWEDIIPPTARTTSKRVALKDSSK